MNSSSIVFSISTLALLLSCATCYPWHEEPLEYAQYGKEKIIKVKVALYLESLCPGCHDFIRAQLYPVFMKYSNFIQLDLLPYGNANHALISNNSKPEYEFHCQHGAPECLGNLYLACATHMLQDQRPKHLIKYYNCLSFSGSQSIANDVKTCTKEAGINLRKLERCTKSDGPKILADFGDRTHNLAGRRFVPTIVVDDEFKIEDQDDIDEDLLGYLCKKFKGAKPADCKSKVSKMSDQFVYAFDKKCFL